MPTHPDENPHHHLIISRLPDWTHRAAPEQWQSLRSSYTPLQGLPGAEADWFANAAPDLREAVLSSQKRLQHAQHALARSLKGLKQIAEFAEPLLRERLQRDHGFSASLTDSELLRVQQTWHWQGGVYTNSHERYSVLYAALQNFGPSETFGEHSAVAPRASIRVQPTRVQGSVFVSPDVPGAPIQLQSETYQLTPLPLSPAALAQSCRALDLGQRYQTHLHEHFESTRNQAGIREHAIAVHRDRLRLAADLGYLRHHLSGGSRDVIQSLLDGAAPPCWQVSLFGIALHEVLIIDTSAGPLLYAPGTRTELRAFATLSALSTAIGQALLDPSARQSFTDYLPLARKADFDRLLGQNLGGDLHLQRKAIEPPLFDFLHQDHIARIKADARFVAVPTADADEQARKRRVAQWEAIGLDALMVAGFFIPLAGTLLLAVTACQVLDEVYEGYQAWSIGDRALALRHCEAVGLNLALLGGLHLAGQIVPPLFNSPLMESLDPVLLDDASHRLWKPDLAPYRSDVQLPADLAANAQGQYLQEGRHFIRIDAGLYEQRLDTATGQWRVLHPSDPKACQPRLEHNHAGAWRAAYEEPQGWTYPTLVRRLGLGHDALSDADLEIAGHISGVDTAWLQHIHLSNQTAPLLLVDTLDRLAAQRLAARVPSELRGETFRQAYEGVGPAGPSVDRLRARYPRLSDPLARRLLGRLASTDRPAWDTDGQLPASLESDIQHVHSDLPLARAMEGLYLPALASHASERLTLACLERLPAWPAQLRLELRAASPQGPLLASAGGLDAQRLRIVFTTSEGYEPYLGERPVPAPQDPDLCRAVLRALPSEHLETLGLPSADAAGLRRHLQTLARDQRSALNRHLWKPLRDRRAAFNLRGGAPTEYPLPDIRTSLLSRYRRLYPRATDTEVEAILSRWRGQLRTPEIELQRLEGRLTALREQLASWSGTNARRQPVVQRLIDTWRHNSVMHLIDGTPIQFLSLRNLSLVNADLATLELPDEFAHVEVLNLSENRELSQLPPAFIERFPGVQYLYLNRCRFDRLPRLGNPAAVNWLDMQGNRITWDAQSQADLERFSALRILDLSENPLIQAPDLSPLRALHSLSLNECSLTRLPTGLEAIRMPLALDLADNQFIHLPDDLQLTAEAGQAMRLESPWLSQTVHDQIARYYAQHQVDLLVADIDYEELLDPADERQWQIWMRLPLQYRRDLRAVAETEFYLERLDQAHAALWQRLRLIDTDPVFRARALARPAAQLLDIMI